MRLVAVLLGLVLTTACATVAHGPLETISVRSEPSGADAVIECDGGVRVAAMTPARIEIPRNADGCVLTVAQPGMVTQRIELRRDISNKFWGALWTGVGAGVYTALATSALGVILGAPPAVFGLVSAAIDASTGRHRTHDPDEIEVKLQRGP